MTNQKLRVPERPEPSTSAVILRKDKVMTTQPFFPRGLRVSRPFCDTTDNAVAVLSDIPEAPVQAPTNTQLMTDVQVAELLNVTPQALRVWRLKGRGPKYLKVGRLVRYDRATIDAWLRGRELSATCQAVRS